jgi:hypothetical protein
VSFNETLQKLGIADAMKPKIKIAQGAEAQWNSSPKARSTSA